MSAPLHQFFASACRVMLITRNFTFLPTLASQFLRRYSAQVTSKLSHGDVNSILAHNEFLCEFQDGPVKSYDFNQLASNNPVEDARSEANPALTDGLLVGIFDGHAGPACAQVVSKRLMRYIAASLVPPHILRNHIANGARSDAFTRCLNDRLDFVAEIRDLYEASFSRFAAELIEQGSAAPGAFQMSAALENAFLRLDADLSNEALQQSNARTMSVAMSGCCAVVAHIDRAHLHVASVGDCQAVLGTLSDTGQWVATKLTHEHNAENINEVRRIIGEHPPDEKETVLKSERLLGQLAPLRAIGDFRYKWTKEQLERIAVPTFGKAALPPNYRTPPYLTARPDITHRLLSPKDRFMVLASDGLWDMMSPMQCVQLVGEHMSGKAFFQPLKLPKREISLGEINQMLIHRREGLSMKPQDTNAATHLIRYALGGTEYGVEHSKLSHMLALPQEIVRLFRDDITITVVYFDPAYLRKCPD